MSHQREFFIDGTWRRPRGMSLIDVINPATEEVVTKVSEANRADIDDAVLAAGSAFPKFAEASVPDRLALLETILRLYDERQDDLAEAVSREMGAPLAFAKSAHVSAGRAYLEATIAALRAYSFAETRGSVRIVHEAIGVCALITPWNWPLTQIICKVAPALAAGCTMVLKPSEVAPTNAIILAEIIERAGVPPGVFNLIHGRGAGVGAVLAGHSGVDMVSFTGSTRAGILVAQVAAPSVKRVTQELGGKSPNIILDDAGFADAVSKGVARCFVNSGQSCSAPSRMLVPMGRHEEALALAAVASNAAVVGDPRDQATELGPLASEAQWDKVQRLIASGIEQGARLVSGGPGRPMELKKGYYVRPTVFGSVRSGMAIEREEIFGPVLSIIPYHDENHAVTIANATPYGLAAYIHSNDAEIARHLAMRLRVGQVMINYPPRNSLAPFGGYKQSGNGRERGESGIREYLETKAIVGYVRGRSSQ